MTFRRALRMPEYWLLLMTAFAGCLGVAAVLTTVPVNAQSKPRHVPDVSPEVLRKMADQTVLTYLRACKEREQNKTDWPTDEDCCNIENEQSRRTGMVAPK